MARGRGSSRSVPLPADWPQLRATRLAMDGYRCTHIRADTGLRCVARATDADHIGDARDHRLDMLRSKCGWHHRQKTSRDAGHASARAARARAAAAQPVHPGLLTPDEIADRDDPPPF